MRPEERQLSLMAFLLGSRFGRTRQQIIHAVAGYKPGEAGRKMLQRDVAFLAGMGVHVEIRRIEGTSEDGNQDHVYVIQRQQVFAPPLRLEEQELQILKRLCDALYQQENFPLRQAASSARSKLQACLRESGERSDSPKMAGVTFLEQIAEAMQTNHKLRLTHWSPWSGEKTSRVIHPRGLVSRGMFWYLAAWCELREDIREFRLDRVDHLEILTETFKVAAADRLADLRFETRRPKHGPHSARLQFDATIAALAARRLSADDLEWRGDELIAQVYPEHPGSFCETLLGWGEHVRVLQADDVLLKELNQRLQTACELHKEGADAPCA